MLTTLPFADRRTHADANELRRLRLAIEASGEIIFTTNPDGIFTYVNPQFERVYGYRFAEVVGWTTPRILKGGTTARELYASFWSDLKQKQVDSSSTARSAARC